MAQLTQPVDTLRALFVHNDWARDIVMDQAAGLSDEQLDRPFEMGPGSLRATLGHLWASESIWLDRWRGLPAPDRSGAGLSLAELRQRFDATAAEREAFLDDVGLEGQSQPVSYTDLAGGAWRHPLGDLMLAVYTHGIHHRAQALNMLRHLGIKPLRLDYLFMVVNQEGLPPREFDMETIAEYWRYTDWAWQQLFEVASGLDEADLDRPFDMGMGTVRTTLAHIHDAERFWEDAWLNNRDGGEAGENGGEKGGWSDSPADIPLREIARAYRQTASRRNEYCGSLAPNGAARQVTATFRPGRPFSAALGDTMLQLCGHAAHHRAQLVNMFRHLGAHTPRLGYVTWARLGP